MTKPLDLESKLEILDEESLFKDPSNLTVILHEEDHTIGNSLKHIICKMPDVEFCGYNVPHPLEDKILVRVQSKQGVRAEGIFLKALEELECIFASIRQKFDVSYETYVSK